MLILEITEEMYFGGFFSSFFRSLFESVLKDSWLTLSMLATVGFIFTMMSNSRGCWLRCPFLEEESHVDPIRE
jgi:hypothetical protein